MMRRVLITGGLGYLGGRLAEHLCEDLGYELTLTSRAKKNWPLPWLRRCQVMQLDMAAKPSELIEICKGYDAIVHLAALNDKACQEYPEQAFSINCLGTFNLLNAAKKAGVRRFIYLSTAHVYGSPLMGDISENTLPKPFHPYALSHKIAEDLVLAAQGNGEIEGVVLRLSNGFGAPVDPSVDCWHLLLNDLARQIVARNEMSLRSSGEQYRNFTTIEDVARAVKHMLELPANHLGDGLYNLGGDQSVPLTTMIHLLAETAEEIFQAKPRLMLGTSTGDAPSLSFNIDKLKGTGFEPRSPIKKELRRLLEFCKEHFDG